jgi:predicted permease
MDVRYAWRRLRSQAGFTFVAMLMLGLGVGSVATLFAVVNGVVLRDVALPDKDRLVGLARIDERGRSGWMSYPDFVDVTAASAGVFDATATFRNWQGALSANGRAETLQGEVVSGDYFRAIGIGPGRGRWLTTSDDVPGTQAVVISDRLWRRWFHGNDGVIGATIKVGGRPFTIVGVAPPSFQGMAVPTVFHADVWVPIHAGADGRISFRLSNLTCRDCGGLMAFGRLKANIGRQRAQSFVEALRFETDERGRNSRARSFSIMPIRDLMMPSELQIGGLSVGAVTIGLALLVLLTACANLAHLVLAQNARRAGELAIRAATGASRAQILRLLLVETALVVAVAGTLGLAMTWVGAYVLSVVSLPAMSGMQVSANVRPDLPVFAFALAVIGIAVVATALVPALRASRLSPAQVIASGGLGGSTTRSRTRTWLIAGQVGASVALLLVAGLLVRSVQAGLRFDRGFETASQAVLRVDLGSQGFDEPRARLLMRRLLDAAGALPGMESAALFDQFPVATGGGTQVFVTNASGEEQNTAREFVAGRSYFQTIRLPLRAGRAFEERDAAGAPRVAIVTPALAERLWPGQTALGQRMLVNGPARPLEVIGVTADVALPGRLARAPLFWTPADQTYRTTMGVVVRTREHPPIAAERIRAALRAVDDSLAPAEVMPLSRYVASAGVAPLLDVAAIVILSLAGVAAVIALVGVYAVVTHYVSTSTKEIGIRIAVGATSRDVQWMVQRKTLRYLAYGAIPGMTVAALTGQLLRGGLLGIVPFDILTFTLVPAALLIVGLAATFRAARRATRVNPVEVLRAS